MKKILLTLGTALMLCLSSYSQQVPGTQASIHLGSQNYVKNNMMPSQIVGSDDQGIYITKVSLKDELRNIHDFPVLERYSKQMELSQFRELKVTSTDHPAQFERIIELGDNLYCFYSTLERGTKTKVLLAQRVNKTTLSLENEVLTIQSLSYDGPAYDSPSFNIKSSTDGSMLLVSHILPDPNSKNELLSFQVLDRHLNTQWAIDYTSELEHGHCLLENYHLSPKGDVYVLTKHVEKNGDLEKFWEPNYHYQILAIQNQGKKTKTFSPEIKGKFLTKMQIATNLENELVCAGLYQDEKASNSVGSYFMTLDSSDKLPKQISFKEFDPVTVASESNKKISRQEKQLGIFAYNLTDMVMRNDGGAILIAEQATMMASNSPRSATHSSKVSYNNIAVISIDPDGQVMWTEEIQKNQIAVGGYNSFSSYATAVMHDKVYLVFNDNPENLCNGVCEPVLFNPKAPQKDVLVALVELDWNGKIKKEALSLSQNINILTKPSACKQVSKNEMVVLGQYNKEYRLARLEFEQTFSY
ncbi:hypothetical protein [Echinicola sp. 20G]|uniref:hypothetical protein n=1 Tax=Echinicola sp. 20G TaxID=2781961 RepID=UPI0019111C5E|nr:hypothetical protein [Echinicola sp. 20G]